MIVSGLKKIKAYISDIKYVYALLTSLDPEFLPHDDESSIDKIRTGLEFCHSCQQFNRIQDEYGYYCEVCQEYYIKTSCNKTF